MPKSLVIVESPTKAKTLSKFLGKDYSIASSMGHIIDLPRNKLGVDVERGFAPQYVEISSKKKIISELKREAKGAKEIYLASDPDREGEAIGWHIAGLLGKEKLVRRVVFHEITKTAIEEAFRHPGSLDMNKVNAQQARRILDRIVGYSISPLLWKKVTGGLSAGRVQSVATRLIVDREREILAFKSQEYWEIEAELKKRTTDNGITSFVAKLEKIGDKKAEIKNREDADKIVNELKGNEFIVKDLQKSTKRKFPQAPFTTSKLAQDAFNKLHFSAAKTMRVAQQLYEGIELGAEGMVGLITYMRTDSVEIAKEAEDAARDFIAKKFGKDYLPNVPNKYKSKKTSQGAHEAIRPTEAAREPEKIKQYLTSEQFKLYDLIWKRFTASQMNPAVLSLARVDIAAGIYLFRANGQEVVFNGFMLVYDADGGEERKLPTLYVDERLGLLKLTPSQHFTEPPPRYTEASLVKALEDKGIGRPSTYAPIIQTIIERGYVERRANSLVPAELGILITDLLLEHFPRIMDVKFTALMEEELDQIEEGSMAWQDVMNDFYGPFSESLAQAQERMKDVNKSALPTDELCERCGKPMVMKWGRFGKFLSCSDFPRCKNAKSISLGVKCPEPGCTGELVARKSKRGRRFYGCSSYPKCRHIANKLPEQTKV